MLVVCLCAFSATTEDSVERRLGGKLLRQFTEARQQCCHPQIVRRDLWLGKSRLSMRQILTRLIHKAFSEYDIAVRAEFTARLLQAAVSCDPADAGDLSRPSRRAHAAAKPRLPSILPPSSCSLSDVL